MGYTAHPTDGGGALAGSSFASMIYDGDEYSCKMYVGCTHYADDWRNER